MVLAAFQTDLFQSKETCFQFARGVAAADDVFAGAVSGFIPVNVNFWTRLFSLISDT